MKVLVICNMRGECVVVHALRDHMPGKLVFRSDGKVISLSTAQETRTSGNSVEVPYGAFIELIRCTAFRR
jgi:hypothetical protein